MNKRKKFFGTISVRWVGSFLVTFLSTVLGVYYGFLLSENKALHERSTQRNIALKNIISEFESNQHELKQTLNSMDKWRQVKTMLEGAEDTSMYQYIAVENYLLLKNPQLFEIYDTILTNGKSIFRGGMNHYFETPDFSFVAYETSKSLNVFSELGFACLYGIEHIYNAQKSMVNESDKLIEALQDRDFDKVDMVVNVSLQLGGQLSNKYEEVLGSMDSCTFSGGV